MSDLRRCACRMRNRIREWMVVHLGGCARWPDGRGPMARWPITGIIPGFGWFLPYNWAWAPACACSEALVLSWGFGVSGRIISLAIQGYARGIVLMLHWFASEARVLVLWVVEPHPASCECSTLWFAVCPVCYQCAMLASCLCYLWTVF